MLSHEDHELAAYYVQKEEGSAALFAAVESGIKSLTNFLFSRRAWMLTMRAILLLAPALLIESAQ
jgi:hypothetical protein